MADTPSEDYTWYHRVGQSNYILNVLRKYAYLQLMLTLFLETQVYLLSFPSDVESLAYA